MVSDEMGWLVDGLKRNVLKGASWCKLSVVGKNLEFHQPLPYSPSFTLFPRPHPAILQLLPLSQLSIEPFPSTAFIGAHVQENKFNWESVLPLYPDASGTFLMHC